MTTAVLNEKRYALSLVCLMCAVFWAGLLAATMHAIADSHQTKTMPCSTVIIENDA